MFLSAKIHFKLFVKSDTAKSVSFSFQPSVIQFFESGAFYKEPEKAMACHTLPYPAIPCHTLSCLAIPCHTLLCLAIPCHTLPYLAMPCHTLPYFAMPCHTLPWFPSLLDNLRGTFDHADNINVGQFRWLTPLATKVGINISILQCLAHNRLTQNWMKFVQPSIKHA